MKKWICLVSLVRTLFATVQQPHLRDIFINQKILPLDKLINQQEGILSYKVINGTFLLNDFLNHGDVIKSILEILVTWGYHCIQQHNLNSLFAIEPSIRGMAYQVTCAAHHRSVPSKINYDSCTCLSHSF